MESKPPDAVSYYSFHDPHSCYDEKDKHSMYLNSCMTTPSEGKLLNPVTVITKREHNYGIVEAYLRRIRQAQKNGCLVATDSVNKNCADNLSYLVYNRMNRMHANTCKSSE
jgi:hypothetical protein